MLGVMWFGHLGRPLTTNDRFAAMLLWVVAGDLFGCHFHISADHLGDTTVCQLMPAVGHSSNRVTVTRMVFKIAISFLSLSLFDLKTHFYFSGAK